MARRSKFLIPAALVAAIGTAGCFPVVSDQQASQQDVIGDVEVSADVCTAPQLLGIVFGGGLRTTTARRATRSGDLRRLARGYSEDFFACPDEEQLEQWLGSGNTEASILFGLPHQVLVAHRVPAGADAPESFDASGEVMVSPFWQQILGDGPSRGSSVARTEIDLNFRRAPEMDAQVEAVYEQTTGDREGAPDLVGDGEKIVGYISDQLPGPLVGDISVAAGFGLPAGTATQPYAGPFNSLTLVGTRFTLTEDQYPGAGTRSAGALRALGGSRGENGDEPTFNELYGPDRPVECLTTESSTSDDILSRSFCPTPVFYSIGDSESFLAELETAVKGVDTATRDLRVLGGEGFAEQGTTASVPFTLRSAGPASTTLLGLSAGTELTGAAATPDQATTPFPGAGDHARTVDVQVPADAAPGTYPVTLTTKVGGQTRTGTGRVVVLPKPAPPVVTSEQQPSRAVVRDNVYMDRDGNIAFGWICPPACGDNQVDVTSPKAGIAPKANTAAVTKPRLLRIARSTFQAADAKRVRVKVRLFPRARKAVRKGRKVKAIIVVRTGGKGVPSVRRVTIKLRKPQR